MRMIFTFDFKLMGILFAIECDLDLILTPNKSLIL